MAKKMFKVNIEDGTIDMVELVFNINAPMIDYPYAETLNEAVEAMQHMLEDKVKDLQSRINDLISERIKYSNILNAMKSDNEEE